MSEPNPEPNEPPKDPPTQPPTTPPVTPPANPDEPLGETGIAALRAEREARRKAEAERQRLEREAEDARREAEQAKQDAEAARAERDTAQTESSTVKAEREREKLRLKVARATGLPANLAERLQGDDEAALTTDAEELVRTLATPSVRMPTNVDAPKPEDRKRMFEYWDQRRT